ncbi:MAG TPA: hypothetical protein VMQ99_06685, partial [Acetobacteraceae bacterium]|nr:hypothetical protein [Acetobacteraceae bacterium]
AAYAWHMRAGTWSTNRDIAAAYLSWERATRIADALPADDSNRTAMRIAPRTMLCANAWRVHEHVAGAQFDELRQLCTAAGDKASLAIGMAGLVMDHLFQARTREASQLASEAMALLDSIGDPTLTVGLSFAPIYAKAESTAMCDVLRWSQRVIELADGDPSKGNLIFGSPLAVALLQRGTARYWLCHPGWRDDLRHGQAMACSADPLTCAVVVGYVYLVAVPVGVLKPDDSVMREIEDALRIAERSSDDLAVAWARLALGVALVHRHTDAERDRGQTLLAEIGDGFLRRGYLLCDLPLVEVYSARERARRADRDDALPLMRATADHLLREGRLLIWGVPATGVLVETLLNRGTDSDVTEAEAAIERLAAAPADEGLAVRDIWLLRLRALLARAHGDAAAYAECRDRYRDMAKTLGFEGHIAWAEAICHDDQGHRRASLPRSATSLLLRWPVTAVRLSLERYRHVVAVAVPESGVPCLPEDARQRRLAELWRVIAHPDHHLLRREGGRLLLFSCIVFHRRYLLVVSAPDGRLGGIPRQLSGRCRRSHVDRKVRRARVLSCVTTGARAGDPEAPGAGSRWLAVPAVTKQHGRLVGRQSLTVSSSSSSAAIPDSSLRRLTASAMTLLPYL